MKSVPNVAFSGTVTELPEIWTFPFAVSVVFSKSFPLGSPETLRYFTLPELSFTVNVGLNVAPRNTTNLAASLRASVDNALPPWIDTVGLTVSFTLTFTGTILDGCSCDAAGTLGPGSCVFGNVTFT